MKTTSGLWTSFTEIANRGGLQVSTQGQDPAQWRVTKRICSSRPAVGSPDLCWVTYALDREGGRQRRRSERPRTEAVRLHGGRYEKTVE
jgi:hypothetical protein